MKVDAPPLLPLLRSQVQGEMLALLYLHPDTSYSLTEIARKLGKSVPGVRNEVERLVRAGYLRDRRVGNVRQVSAATDTPVYRPLTDLLLVTFGPKPVLVDLLAPLAGVDEAYIYGSWAARYTGESGPIPNDIDVLVVGDADRDELDDMAHHAQQNLDRPVNITRIRRTAWNSAEPQPFVQAVRSGPLVSLLDDRRSAE
ncbi:ArsR family transcriptional regulator [Jatrophihabitans sp.]|uniref:ArsR family transcriptional regulator n=1 Tax=Jatrophihabitans sp. TaxID=1932789 RepID=UPI002CA39A48|nr:hypothetical protein [Jatrophihabitans sp.]